jgi:hypothetical protein
MPKIRPSNDDLLTAAEWLDVNEGDDGEKESCHATAVWLRSLVDKSDETNAIKKIAKEAGVPISRARQAWKARKEN